MRRKQLLLLLPVLSLLLLGSVWAILRPEGSPLIPFTGDKPAHTATRSTDEPLEGNPARPAGNDTPDGDGALDIQIDAAERERIREAREIARREAELAEKESAQRMADANRVGPQPAPGNTITEDNRTPEQKALDAERDRRIAQLRAIKRPPNQSLGNHRPRARAIKSDRTKPLDEVNARLMQDRRGLYAKYYHFTRNPLEDILDPTLPEFEARTPTLTRIDPKVYFPSKAEWSDLPFDLTYFMGVWTGFLVIKEAGDYWFYLGADWTGVVSLYGEAILFNDMRDYTEVSTVITLEPGLHPIRIDYMEGKNGSVIDHMGACNFMYVPEGSAKPVPVPAEMLMLPEELWSANAPIITKLSQTSGEIGDEITIHGQGLYEAAMDEGGILVLPQNLTTVEFAGQNADILQASETSLRVKVPIGATTGKVIVSKHSTAGSVGGSLHQGQPRISIPSNSVDFTVTTQFGLMASWHNLQGWSKYDFVDEQMHEPDIVRLEREFMFENRSQIDLPFRNNPLACRWDGKLGIPAGFATSDSPALVRFVASGRMRVTLGGVTKVTQAQPGVPVALTTLDFEAPTSGDEWDEKFLPLSIEWTSETGAAALKIVKMSYGGEQSITNVAIGDDGVVETDTITTLMWREVGPLPTHLFFPPVVPPLPPKIHSAIAIPLEGGMPVLPFDDLSRHPSIREGQGFTLTVDVYGKAEAQSEPLVITVDGRPVTYTETNLEQVNPNTTRRTLYATLPDGLGEGRMMARHSIVMSEPYYIDVLNKGLIAYLYDLPNPGGYTKMPDLGPLMCFQVRKDPWVNFENANDFNLPFPAETFAIEWLGALIVEREGFYRFTGRSDDGIIMWLDEAVVLIDDNLHYQRERTGDWVWLSPGLYKFRMQFFENNVHEVCVLSWEAREDKDDETREFLPRQIIPKRHFTWDDHPPLPSKVSTFKRTDGSNPE